MPNNYLNPESPLAFYDIPERELPPDYIVKKPVACPVCKKHGHWNLLINEYGPGKHFQATCCQCNGWGYVEENSLDATCIHKWKTWWARMFERHDKCEKCGREKIYDTSG